LRRLAHEGGPVTWRDGAAAVRVGLWREAPFYTERERAALAWTEAVALVSIDHVPDGVYETARQHFDEKELIDLTAAIVAINGWNRLAIAFRTVPGSFQIGKPSPGDREAYSTSSGQLKAAGR
jgi:hypothetical protein